MDFLFSFSFCIFLLIENNNKNQSRSKCLPQAEFTQHQGLIVANSTNTNTKSTAAAIASTSDIYNLTDQFYRTRSTPTTATTPIKKDRLLSEVNSIDLLADWLNFDTMTKTMDSFSDPHSYTVIPNSIAGFDEPLLTPVIGKLYFEYVFPFFELRQNESFSSTHILL